MLSIIGLALVLATASMVVAAMRPAGALSFFLGVYLAGWATLVLAIVPLSVADRVGRGWLFASLTAALLAGTMVWIFTGRARPPSFAGASANARQILRDPIFAVLAATVVGAFSYVAVVGVATPQNEWDSLSYHLARAAFWLQQQSVAYVPAVADARINGNPPVAEIGQLAALALNRDDAFVWLPQFAAVVALCLAAFGIARRAGLDDREACFGALVLACLPLVLLQASTALNDLVVASFLATATYFALGSGRRSGAAAALALGLALGTKVVALFLLPIYLVVVLASRRRRPVEQITILFAGGVIGSGWYILNVAETGAWDGGLAAATNQVPDRGLLLVLSRVVQLGTDALGLPGAVGADVLVYPLSAAAFVIAVAAASTRRGRSLGLSPFLSALIVVLVPVAVWCLARGTTAAWRFAWVASGRDAGDTSIPAGFSPATHADSTATWFGPVGALLTIGGVILAFSRAGRGRSLRIACSLMPFAMLVVVAASVPYDPWRGRFFVYAMALASVAWGLAFRTRALAWGIALVSVATVVLVLVHSNTKPPGIRLLEPAARGSVFGKPRWRVETWIRRDDGTDDSIRYVEEHVPARATIGLALGINDFVFPYFGKHLSRTVRLVRPEASAPGDVEWLVAAPSRNPPRCPSSWERMLTTASGFRVWHRVEADRCEGGSQPESRTRRRTVE